MAPQTSTVSVLMPVHNGADYLTEAVESILAQTYPIFTFVIVDDGSTDGSAGILQAFAAIDPRITLVAQEQQGVARALNRGLAEAHGDIVVRMDSDDIAHPTRIARQTEFLGSHPEIVAAGSQMNLIDGRGASITKSRYPIDHSAIVAALHRGESPMAHPTIAFRRDAVLAVGGYRPAFEYAEDYDLWLRLSERYQLANMSDVLLEYRSHGENLSVRRRPKQILALQLARLAAQERRQGRPDPTAELGRMTIHDLHRFDLSLANRDAILLSLSESALALYTKSGQAAALTDAEESYLAHGYSHPTRARRIGHGLARSWWHAGRRRRSLGVIRWTAQTELACLARHHLSNIGDHSQLSRAMRSLAVDWVMHSADPQNPRTPPPDRTLPAQAAPYLVTQALDHGVLPAVLRNFMPLSTAPSFAATKSLALARHREVLAMSVMLDQHARELMTAASSLPVAIVKGPVFARTIYPGIGSRPFTDIDLLVAPRAVAELSTILSDHGFGLAEEGDDRIECKWLHRSNAALMVEVHTNLVHSAGLHDSLSLTYDDIAGQEDAPATQLIVAIIHGSLGGHFEQLRSVADICQAARALASVEDERRFEQLVSRTGAHLAALTGLVLAGRCFAEPRCLDIASSLGPASYSRLARLLIAPNVLRSNMTSDRWRQAWRRQAFRQLLKWSKGPVPS